MTNPILFVNSETIMLLHDGEMMRVNTKDVRTETLLRVAGDILHVVAGRDVRREIDAATPDRGVPGAGLGGR